MALKSFSSECPTKMVFFGTSSSTRARAYVSPIRAIAISCGVIPDHRVL